MTAAGVLGWLGDSARRLTADELARFAAVYADAEIRYGEERAGERNAALESALAYLVGELTPADSGVRIATARQSWREATAAAAAVAQLAYEDGESEKSLAAAMGVDRANTMRRWLGKS